MKQNLVFPISLFKYIMFTFIRKIKEDGILITIITRINLSPLHTTYYYTCYVYTRDFAPESWEHIVTNKENNT